MQDEKLRRIAYHDALTGLLNRLALRERLASDIELAVASGLPVALLLLDLDNFKLINDTLRHDAGDAVLVQAADRDMVRATLHRILANPRYSGVEVLASQFGDRRRFKEWSMAYVGDSEALRSQFSTSPLAAFGSRPAGDALLDIMLELARSTVDPDGEDLAVTSHGPASCESPLVRSLSCSPIK